MKIYRVKPKFNGSLNKDFTNPNEAIDYFLKHNSTVCGKMYGSTLDRLEEIWNIGKLEIIQVER